MTRNRRALAGLMMAALSLASLRAQNQAYDQFAPKPVPPTPAVPANLPASTNVVAGEPEGVLLPVLRGLVFVAGPAGVEARARTDEGVVLAGGVQVPAPEAFRRLAAGYIGRPLTRGGLNKLITAVIVHYREHNHPVVDVIVPQQDITGGVVQVILLESRVGRVTLTGNRWFSDQEIRADFSIRPGDPIVASDMRSDLEWANQNPFHTTDVVYQPGAESGTTDILLQTQDRFPARFYAGYEDSGNQQTGFDRYLVGFNWGDAWDAGWGHQLNYQYTTSGDFRSLEAHSGSYVIPLPWWHHTLTFFGNYVTTQGVVPPVLSLRGVSYQVSGRYSIPLRPWGEVKHAVGFGFDYKYNKNSLLFGEIPLTATPIEVRQLVATYDASRRDSLGIWSFNATGYWSPGDWGGDNNDTVFGEAHTFATARYDYANFTLSRLTRLPQEWSLFLKGTLQVSDANLTPSEQLGLGGYDTVRGYDEREVNSDEGYLFNIELRTPSMSIGKRFGWTRWKDQLQFLAFWDYGVGYDHTLLPGEPSDTPLSAVGAGLRFTIDSNVSVRADYGFQLHKTGLDREHGSRGDIGVVISY
jgi:hemolysin activation/secretion protein